MDEFASIPVDEKDDIFPKKLDICIPAGKTKKFDVTKYVVLKCVVLLFCSYLPD